MEKLLFALDGQQTDRLFSFSAVVVDNDCAESARDTVSRVGKEVQYQIEYYVEPQQNISLARNMAVLNARGDFIAMIDDDEVPISEWLYFLFKTIRSCKADGVMGPVRPVFSSQAPQWLIRSGLCERPSYPTGTIVPSGRTRAGNVLIDRRVFDNGKNLFEEQFGRTGGEDVEFFDKRIEEGFIFVWCDEAPAYEYVPPERCLFSFHLKKCIRFGGLTGEKMRMGTFPLWGNFMMSAGVTTVYTVVLPIFAFCGWHVFIRHLVRYVYHISRLLGTLGIVIIRDR